MARYRAVYKKADLQLQQWDAVHVSRLPDWPQRKNMHAAM